MDATDTRCSYQPSPLDRNMYYILTENHYYGSKLFQAGSMCYLKEQTYLQHISRTSTRLWRFVMEQDGSVATLDVESLQPVNEKMADFLLAISNAQERLNCFLDRQALEAAVTAEEGQQVLVDLGDQFSPATVRYIGRLHHSPLPSGLHPIYFGVELQGGGEGRGLCAGTYHGAEYFKCKPKCGLFLPFNKLQFLPASEDNQVEAKRQKADGIVPVKMGDTVGFYLDDAFMRGIVLEVYQKGNEWLVKVCPEEEGSADVFREIPLDSVVKEELLSLDQDSGLQEYLKHKRSESTEHPADGTCSLDVNSVVQINLDKGRAVTGTIRWIGCLPNAQQRMAGIELIPAISAAPAGASPARRTRSCAGRRGSSADGTPGRRSTWPRGSPATARLATAAFGERARSGAAGWSGGGCCCCSSCAPRRRAGCSALQGSQRCPVCKPGPGKGRSERPARFAANKVAKSGARLGASAPRLRARLRDPESA